MSLLNPKTTALALFIAASSLSACGYQPMMSQPKANSKNQTPVYQELTKVWIERIQDREGQLLQNQLATLLAPRGSSLQPEYKLQIDLTVSKSTLGFGKDDLATRANLNLNADFNLSGKQSFSGTSSTSVSYNILTSSPSGTEFVERDALHRGIDIIARDIHRRLAARLIAPTP